MPKVADELSALQVSRLKTPGLHSVGGVAGLQMQISESGSRSWVLRVRIGAKRRDIGLGGYPTVTLAQARERARGQRELVWQGVDPVEDRAARRRALLAAQGIPTFEECVRRFLKSKTREFRNAKHAAQWETTLDYAASKFGKLPVRDIGLPQVLEVLEPMWLTTTETASRLRGRIEAVLSWATVAGYRSGDNPARWQGNLDAVLPKPTKVRKVEHHAAMPHDQVPSFVEKLRERPGVSPRAVEFALLTAARSGEIRGARWDEVDLEAGVWTIPAGRMKAGKEHRIPLSAPALDLLRALPRDEKNTLVFPGPRSGSPMSDMSLTAVMKRMGIEVTMHGFRSSFRDWAGETTNFPREVIEHALAHQLKDKAEAAYARGTLFDKRRKLMDAWARYCTTKPASSAKVVPIDKGKAA